MHTLNSSNGLSTFDLFIGNTMDKCIIKVCGIAFGIGLFESSLESSYYLFFSNETSSEPITSIL